MAEHLKKHWQKYLLSIIVLSSTIFILPPCIHWLLTEKFLSWSFVSINNYDSWVNYISTIIGASVTLIGIYWTIQHEKKFRSEEISLQYKPILLLSDNSLDNNKKSIICKNNEKAIKEDTILSPHIRRSCLLKLKNVGRGEAINTKISFTHEENEDNFSINGYLYTESNLDNITIPLIVAGERIYIYFKICFKETRQITINNFIDFNTIITYTSINGETNYEIKIPCKCRLSYYENITCENITTFPRKVSIELNMPTYKSYPKNKKKSQK